MKVAIIGAGIAGLSCAVELEKHGVGPVIYEENPFVGNLYPHVSTILEISYRPVGDVLKHFKDKLGIDIKPLNEVKAVVHNSPGKTTTIRGRLGYFLKNNRETDSVRAQLCGRLNKSAVKLDAYGDYEKLEKEYDRVVIATGQNTQALELGCWQPWINTYIKGACVAGEFDPNMMVMWINKDYCKDGYAYLTPFGRERASIVLVVTDVGGNEVDNYWSLFLNAENIKYEIMETFKLPHNSGYVYPLAIGKFIFAGNAAGGLDPFLGFGSLQAVTMGVSAARAIAAGISYEKQIKSVISRNNQMKCFRQVFNTLTNKDYDNIVSIIGFPAVKNLIYDTRFNIVKTGAILSKMLLRNRS